MAIDWFPVEAGHVLTFARAIGDPNPIYADRSYAEADELGGLIAPPTFVQAGAQFDPEYRLRPPVGGPWFGSGAGPNGDNGDDVATGERVGGNVASALHAEQHFTYHRTLRVGDVLSASVQPGNTWEKVGRRGGTLKFSESITEYRDPSGALVITARSVGVHTERQPEE